KNQILAVRTPRREGTVAPVRQPSLAAPVQIVNPQVRVTTLIHEISEPVAIGGEAWKEINRRLEANRLALSGVVQPLHNSQSLGTAAPIRERADWGEIKLSGSKIHVVRYVL